MSKSIKIHFCVSMDTRSNKCRWLKCVNQYIYFRVLVFFHAYLSTLRRNFWNLFILRPCFQNTFAKILGIYFISVWVLIKMVINRKLLLRLVLIYPRMSILIFEEYKYSNTRQFTSKYLCRFVMIWGFFRHTMNASRISKLYCEI